MEYSIKKLKNAHKGKEIYVLGSASSMDYVDPDYFKGRISIGCNYLFRKFPVQYTVAKELHKQEVREAVKVSKVVLSKHPCGNINFSPTLLREGLDVDYYTFSHKQNLCSTIDWSVLGTDELVVSWSTITSAIHLAAYMGAKTIFLMGVDGGTLDGKINYDTYYREEHKVDVAWYKEWVPQILATTCQLRDKLYEVYGCRTMLVSPFLNFKLEGHVFE